MNSAIVTSTMLRILLLFKFTSILVVSRASLTRSVPVNRHSVPFALALTRTVTASGTAGLFNFNLKMKLDSEVL